MKFGPSNAEEALVFATEELKADTQYEILRALANAGMSQADLARKLGVSQAWVSQALSDDANLTIDTIAKIFLGLGLQCHFSSQSVQPHYAQAGMAVKLDESAWTRPAMDSVSAVARSADRETTTAMLMRAINSSCRDRRPVMMQNDNGGKPAPRQPRVAA
ncbi:XRE family transcriptional regulator [Rhizobium deserti]|uniref:XRE family transcriptional regulator n=1 Tax=Rhizobium deserti TaxID=2547961 RepID=A0A4R5UH06_9HYPH|nr:helix-turn-helix transcriptional regulator [Rhizobium deserti]TDK35213.1 XRE family transcriptional regulator [Rhizobium deserti]